jgi:hypothetical protein
MLWTEACNLPQFLARRFREEGCCTADAYLGGLSAMQGVAIKRGTDALKHPANNTHYITTEHER